MLVRVWIISELAYASGFRIYLLGLLLLSLLAALLGEFKKVSLTLCLIMGWA
jgi:hypothetical protein